MPNDSKEAVEDDVWPDGTFVPAGTIVAFTPHVMGRDPELWPEPMEFRYVFCGQFVVSHVRLYWSVQSFHHLGSGLVLVVELRMAIGGCT